MIAGSGAGPYGASVVSVVQKGKGWDRKGHAQRAGTPFTTYKPVGTIRLLSLL